MSRIKDLFNKKNSNVLNVYCTAGFPHLCSTLEVMNALQESGADIIELGMPYSDPLADGEVIQASSGVAIANGMTIEVLFEQLKAMRNEIQIPVILMGYLNPILQYGFERFCKRAKEVGIDGLILPDIPMFEFETEYNEILSHYEVDFIFLVTPETSEERIRKADKLGSGFIYAVSSSSTTGKNKSITEQQPYFERLKSLQLRNPVLVGFGIKDKATFEAACTNTNGAIIGTAYIKALENGQDISSITKAFINGVKG
ncbi:MAG: tryptophan synthase subunit alpha [Segetibacter sp.]|nr:tryptophan synthase subunit alpha [Segetibacter sp.]